eukprot:gene11477-11621_t
MQGFSSTVETKLTAEAGWTELMTGAYKGTFVFGYIVCVMFMLFFLALLIFSDPITKELGIYEQMQQNKRLLEMNALSAD